MTSLQIFAQSPDFISQHSLESRVAASPPQLQGPRVRTPGIRDCVTAEMVHDFRNILGTIHGLADLAFLELLEDSAAAPLVDEIRRACRNGGELCRQLLDRSRTELVELESIDLAQVVRELELQLRMCIAQKFALELDLAPAPVAASRGQLRRVLINLVKNAAESLEGRAGVVRISTGVSAAPVGDSLAALVPLDASRIPTSFLIVSDTGRGMSKTARKRLLKGSLTTKPDGHGLGFASVRRIVANGGGSLRISSEAGRGTTVTLVFPHADAASGDIVIDPDRNMRTVQPDRDRPQVATDIRSWTQRSPEFSRQRRDVTPI